MHRATAPSNRGLPCWPRPRLEHDTTPGSAPNTIRVTGRQRVERVTVGAGGQRSLRRRFGTSFPIFSRLHDFQAWRRPAFVRSDGFSASFPQYRVAAPDTSPVARSFCRSKPTDPRWRSPRTQGFPGTCDRRRRHIYRSPALRISEERRERRGRKAYGAIARCQVDTAGNRADGPDADPPHRVTSSKRSASSPAPLDTWASITVPCSMIVTRAAASRRRSRKSSGPATCARSSGHRVGANGVRVNDVLHTSGSRGVSEGVGRLPERVPRALRPKHRLTRRHDIPRGGDTDERDVACDPEVSTERRRYGQTPPSANPIPANTREIPVSPTRRRF